MNKSEDVDKIFFDEARKISSPCVLEMGTKRSNPGVSTSVARDWFPDASRIIRTDIEPCVDVDLVADAHDLFCKACREQVIGWDEDRFDILLCRSVLEHLAKPWIACEEMVKCVKPDGLIYVQTHQTFPLHGYPSDYFRFSKEALEVLFESCDIVTSGYKFPVSINSAEVPGMKSLPAFLNSYVIARRK